MEGQHPPVRERRERGEAPRGRSALYVPRSRLEIRLEAMEPGSVEESEVVAALAEQLSLATAVVADDPEASYPAGSIGAKVKEAFSRLAPETRTACGRNARTLLAGSAVERRRYFGRYASADREEHDELLRRRLSPELEVALRGAVRKRLELRRSEIVEFLLARQSGQISWMPVTKTSLLVGRGQTTDLPSPLEPEATMNEPETLDFRWSTEEEEAEEAVWELVQPPSSQVIGSGYAGKAPGGLFSIPFQQYLPPQPAQDPHLYQVRVVPRTAMKITPASATPGSQAAAKVPPQVVGPPSPPVRIYYARSSYVQPPWDFPRAYLKLEFHLDQIEMIQDQFGPGAEEFHVAGFIREVAGRSGEGAQITFGPLFASLDPGGPRTESFAGAFHPFSLTFPNAEQWPRIYTVVFSIMEEDGGEEIGVWLAKLWEVAEGVIREAIADAVKEALKEMTEAMIEEILVSSAENAAIAAGVASGIASSIAAIVVVVLAEVISAIVADMEDDYYGTKAFVMTLLSNRTDGVRALAGAKELSGQYSGGMYHLAPTTGWFYGAPGKSSASAFDGIVELTWHWRLSQDEEIVWSD